MGKRGTCKSFHDCYPLLKVADLSGWDGWVMGHYDTCSYISGDNMEVRIRKFQAINIFITNSDSITTFNVIFSA